MVVINPDAKFPADYLYQFRLVYKTESQKIT